MIIKEFTALDTCDRKRIFAECKCPICNNIYTRQKRQLNQYFTCSIGCTNIAKGNSIVCQCSHCNVTMIRPKSDLKASKSGKLFCSRKCKDTAQTYMTEIRPEHYGNGEYSYREKAFRNYKPICMVCGYDNKDALEVHHIDKNRQNNDISNLKILCANCHTIEHKGLRTGVQR